MKNCIVFIAICAIAFGITALATAQTYFEDNSMTQKHLKINGSPSSESGNLQMINTINSRIPLTV